MSVLENTVDCSVVLPHFTVQLATHRLAEPGRLELCEPVHTISLQRRLSGIQNSGRFRVPGAVPLFGSIGRVMVVPAGVPLQIRASPGPTHTVRCRVHPERLAEIIGEPLQLEPERLHGCLDVDNLHVRDLLLRLGSELESPGFAHRALVESLGHALIIEVVRHLRATPQRHGPGKVGLTEPVFRRLLERLDDMAQPPGLTELAELCGLSVRHLTRAFRERTGTSIHRHLERQRLARATALLHGSAMPVADIARELGFASPAYFATAFRRATGHAPAAYRKAQAGRAPAMDCDALKLM